MSTDTAPIPFVDLQAQRARIADRLEPAMARVLEHGRFIMGPEVIELEAELARFCGVAEVVSCSSGTDALLMPLMAWGIGPGDAVLVPSFTFVATAEVVAMLGATPVAVDVREDTFGIDPELLPAAIEAARALGLAPRALIAVDLFGLPVDYERLGAFCTAEGLHLLADAAQSFGGELGNRRVGALAPVTATSFFPAKPLGCYGDGGAIMTDDADFAATLRSIRVHGQGSDKYDNVRLGLNGRLDTLQAAVLLAKLEVLEDELAARRRIAARYADGLGDVVVVPEEPAGRRSGWGVYTIRTERRDALQAHLSAAGVPSMIYYLKPVHRQTAYRDHPWGAAELPVSDALADSVLSLPMHPYVSDAQLDRIIGAIRGFHGR